jgi:arylsulfatase A-like enzyme
LRDPFARLTRRQRWHSHAWRLRRLLARSAPRRRRRPAGTASPHLLAIGIDTLRADHLGCGGCARATSPRLDALAAGGTLFADVMAPAPWTLPSFAGALTGLMPGLHGGFLGGPERNMDRQAPGRLRPGAVTLAAHLRAQGYRTAAFYANQFFAFGLAESFQEHAYFNLPARDLADMAGDWLERNSDHPCFCFVLVNDPHEPTTPPWAELAPFLPSPAPDDALLAELARWGGGRVPHLGRVPDPRAPAVQAACALKLAVYDATIAQVDRALGALHDRLLATGLAERTLTTVFSDHGEEFLDHAAWAARWDHDPRGLRGIGHGQSHFQELLHVPWLAWGAGVPVGARVEGPVSLLDLAPTLLEWLGQPPLPVAPLPTQADPGLVAALRGRSQAPAAARAAVDGVRPEEPERLRLAEAIAYGPDLVAVRRGNWKLVAARDGRPLALFDLERDPGELEDASTAAPDVLRDLLAVAGAWQRSGLGAAGDGGGAWGDLDDTVRERLRDLGYTQ